MRRRRGTPAQRFMHHVRRRRDGHWHWIGKAPAGDSGSIGQFNMGGPDRKRHAPGRAAWLIFRGEIPDQQGVVNGCGVARCVNPEHLRLGNGSSAACWKPRRGEESFTAKLTAEAVAIARRMARAGWTSGDLGRLFGVAQPTMSKAVRGLNWAHVEEPPIGQRQRGDGIRSAGYMRPSLRLRRKVAA